MNTDHIHWLGHATFRIEDDTLQLYIDPWKLPEHAPKADIILITHAHFDHFSPEDIAKIQKPNTLFVAPRDVGSQLKGNVVIVEPGKEYTAGRIKVRTIPAYNPNKKFHPKTNQWVGYLITLTNGQTIYHAGDTDAIPEMKQLKVDVALMPCGGTYTMTAEEMAEAANNFMPKVLIPMHWGDIVGVQKDAETVKKIFKGTTVIKNVER
ncbi:MAG: MBL fold metallo-hydrolase [Bacteroidetes bacterium]|nr:MBL fold metallo-hydrolase [Bacteroidota bacterium]